MHVGGNSVTKAKPGLDTRDRQHAGDTCRGYTPDYWGNKYIDPPYLCLGALLSYHFS